MVAPRRALRTPASGDEKSFSFHHPPESLALSKRQSGPTPAQRAPARCRRCPFDGLLPARSETLASRIDKLIHAAAPAPSLLEPRDVVPPRTSAVIDAHLARLGEASGGGTFGIETGALGPPPAARSLSATYPASPPRPTYPASPSRSTYSVSPPRSPIPFAPVCPPPPRAPSPAPSPLTLDGLGLGGRPPGLDAPSEAETLQTEISESLSDALR